MLALAPHLVELGSINRWQAEQLKVGHTKFALGPYLVLDSIGQGGMGQVFKAEHRLMGRVVAVKVLPRHRSTPRPPRRRISGLPRLKLLKILAAADRDTTVNTSRGSR